MPLNKEVCLKCRVEEFAKGISEPSEVDPMAMGIWEHWLSHGSRLTNHKPYAFCAETIIYKALMGDVKESIRNSNLPDEEKRDALNALMCDVGSLNPVRLLGEEPPYWCPYKEDHI